MTELSLYTLDNSDLDVYRSQKSDLSSILRSGSDCRDLVGGADDVPWQEAAYGACEAII
jgi:hypothetical protein